ncbi:hypothetical protein LTR36_000346 [Oleoguttula mirabilis]|uniref:Uncharacterized protein n=1 Tax=Oleoguttula mirabilis TaxID=1507867 RepID=A0AAV9JYJ2_9PEZI|nr:hypothetical protein LTR36_000346 [Oleoguttula mirabilis]
MKFRSTSFQISREIRDDATTAPSTMPFKMASLRHKKSRAMYNDYELEQQGDIGAQDAPKQPDTVLLQQQPQQHQQQLQLQQLQQKQQQEQQQGDVRKAFSRKRAMQDFFRSTQANIKTTGANIKASSSKLPRRMTVRKAKVVKQPPSKRNSSQMRSLDMDRNVLDKLMGPPKPESSGRIQSPNFLSNQRIQASARAAASSPRVALLSTPGRSQAELDRQPLSVEELQDMFIGAPYFSVEKMDNGQYRPQVVFRGENVAASARYGRDYASLGHASFEASTLCLHMTRQTVGGRAPGRSEEDVVRKPGDNLLEVPGMLSANGLDPGTIGSEHFLQLPIADSSRLPDEPHFFDKRKLLCSQPESVGLREPDMELIIDRLTELGELHATRKSGSSEPQPWSDEKVEEMGEDLFARVLDPELGTTQAGTGSVTLKTQIEALQKVLDETELWHDFSQVEWRIRVGQVLWTSQEDESVQLDEHRQPSERDVVLLQIMLAAELLVRLDTLKFRTPPAESEEEDRGGVSNTQHSGKIQWDLVLAQIFLENLTISAKPRDGSSKANHRSSLFSTISYLTAKETPEDDDQTVEPLLFPRNEEKQLAGLLYFADAIGWPHVQDVQSELEAKLMSSVRNSDRRDRQNRPESSSLRPVSGVSMYATPLSSPAFAPPPMYTPSTRADRSSGYFGGIGLGAQQQQQQPRQQQQNSRPGFNRMTTANSMQLLAASSAQDAGPDAFEVGGWLSRSWLTGLVLPGEPASHFLISTLLENSPQAIEALGDAANLYGGFSYAGRTFWSKSCVVGRVLAATGGAKECMGWVSVPGLPAGHQRDGWVDVDVKDAPASHAAAGGQARIKGDGVAAKDSDPLHGASVTAMQAGDFTIPADGPPVMGNEVDSHGLSFTPLRPSSHALLANAHTNTEEGGMGTQSTSTAHLTFSSPLNTKLAKLDVPLTYDVHFIASYPCHPSLPQHSTTSKLSSPLDTNKPASPANTEAGTDVDASLDAKASIAHPTDSGRTSAITSVTLSSFTIEKELPPRPAHPLHIDYHFEVVPVATLLSAPPESGRNRALSSPEQRVAKPTPGSVGAANEVVVLDCRGTNDLELLARAWCAKVGENALIGKSGRTCLACCVREARALGVGVVVRT